MKKKLTGIERCIENGYQTDLTIDVRFVSVFHTRRALDGIAQSIIVCVSDCEINKAYNINCFIENGCNEIKKKNNFCLKGNIIIVVAVESRRSYCWLEEKQFISATETYAYLKFKTTLLFALVFFFFFNLNMH